ncbi:MAG: YigZ family protein [Bacteroidia bacterium]|nr:YigZ family protein [Bacteroidia bacterium]
MEENPIYKINSESEGFFKDRGSKFYAFAYPVQNESEVAERVGELKKRFHDARHHCYAYRLGKLGESSYATDDGEPSHSAGTPILSAIRSFELTFTLVVVVRYFGGTKLGVRGLIEAYRTAAEEALKENPKEEIIPKVIFSLTFPYDKTSDINRVLHPHPTKLLKADYTDICKQTFFIRKNDYPPLAHALKQANIHWDLIEED